MCKFTVSSIEIISLTISIKHALLFKILAHEVECLQSHLFERSLMKERYVVGRRSGAIGENNTLAMVI